MRSKTIRIIYISVNGSEISPLASAFRELKEEIGDFAELDVIAGNSLCQIEKVEDLAANSDLVLIRLHGGKKSLTGYDRFIPAIKQSGTLLHIQDSSSPDPEFITLTPRI